MMAAKSGFAWFMLNTLVPTENLVMWHRKGGFSWVKSLKMNMIPDMKRGCTDCLCCILV